MAFYKILLKKSAEKELRHFPRHFIHKVLDKIKALSDNPRPVGSEMLAGENAYFRVRQGDYRIVYEIDDTNHEVTVIKIGHRSEVYRK